MKVFTWVKQKCISSTGMGYKQAIKNLFLELQIREKIKKKDLKTLRIYYISKRKAYLTKESLYVSQLLDEVKESIGIKTWIDVENEKEDYLLNKKEI